MSLTVQERCAAKHSKQPQFIAHMQFVEGMSKAEAEARWNRDIENSAIKRNGVSPDTEVPAEPIEQPRRDDPSRAITSPHDVRRCEGADASQDHHVILHWLVSNGVVRK